MARYTKKESRRSKLNWIVTVLVAAVVGFCALSSWQEKSGEKLGLPALELPPLSFLQDIFDEFTANNGQMDNAMAVSGPVSSAQLEVHILDMGQADAILIKGPKANALIDAGENNQGGDVLRYLQQQGVHRLDYVIGTHPHSDHIGGLDTVVGEMDVGQMILPVIAGDLVPTTQTYTDLLAAIGEKGLKITPAKPGGELDLGGGALLRIVGPVGEYADLNNYSVVARLSYGSRAFLFTGDMCEAAEADLMETGAVLRADVLDIGHHGSSTSTSPGFLQAVGPKIATISCGVDNSYGHPHRVVIEQLESRGVEVLRTDRNGAIVFTCDGDRLESSTEK